MVGSTPIRFRQPPGIPGNDASIRLLENTGFQREGFARQYLCINGIWQDHILFARLRDDPSP